MLPVQRQRKRRLRHAHCRDGSGGEGQEGGAAAAAAATSDSDLEDDFEPVGLPRPGHGKRIRRASAVAAAAGEEVDSLDDSFSSGSEGQDCSSGDEMQDVRTAAAAGRAVKAAGRTGVSDADGCSTTAAAAAAQLLHSVIQRFSLNPAQAAVAAHVAAWLPQLMQDVQQRQQQGKKRGIAWPLGTAAAAAGAASGPLLAAGSAAAAAGWGLAAVAGVGDGSSGGRAPVCLIHGPFGSGKSTLLVALIHLLTGLADQKVREEREGLATGFVVCLLVGWFAPGATASLFCQQARRRVRAGLPMGACDPAACPACVRDHALPQGDAAPSKAKQQQRPTPRILVAARTNVAVDRVLLGLQEAGFSNMLRVGSLARIAKRLLGVSLHSAGVWVPEGCRVAGNTGQSAQHLRTVRPLFEPVCLCLCGLCMCVCWGVVIQRQTATQGKTVNIRGQSDLCCLCLYHKHRLRYIQV